jgi:molybdopterin/thiamine biosynthesis adenylyltransferase
VTATAGAPRFSRQRLISGWDQERLASSTMVVVGVGALGNEVAKNLALAGVGRLVLCDPDTVDPSNLSRTVLFHPGTVGTPKPVAAAGALAELAPDLKIETRVMDLVSGVGLGELDDAAVVLGCLDSRRSRLQLLGRCTLVDAALVDGGTHPWGGEVRLRLHPDPPCYACTLTAADRAESDLPWNCAVPAPGGPAPSSIVATAITAGWMTLAALRLAFGDEPAYQVLAIDGTTGGTAPVLIDRDPACPHHRRLDGPVECLPVSHRETVGALLDVLEPGEVPLGWQEFASTGAEADRWPGARSIQLPDAGRGAVLRDLGVAPEEILPVLGTGGYRWLRLKA